MACANSDATAITNSNLKFEEFLKATTKGKPSTVVANDQANTSTKVSDKGGGKENLVAVPPPCVHLNGCGPNSLKSSRVFKSLENLCISEDSSAEKSTPPPPLGNCFCASLTDPYFPFIRCDGKSISKALLDVYTGTDESSQGTDEDKENETEVEIVPQDESMQGTVVQENVSVPRRSSSTLPNGSIDANESCITVKETAEVNNQTEPITNIEKEVQIEPVQPPGMHNIRT